MIKKAILGIAIILFYLLGAACQNNGQEKSSQKVVDPEIICGLASAYAESNLQSRLDNVPKWLIVAMEKLAYYTDSQGAPVLHEKLQQAIDYTYMQDIPKDNSKKLEFMEQFPQMALENCIKHF